MINETDTKKGNSMDLNRQLIEAMADLNEDLVIATVRQMAAEGHSFEEIQQCLNTGISAVGTRFERGDYFIADLIVSGMIYRSALNEREPLRSGGAPRPLGKVVIGVVAGDIHDIGKDIIVSLLRAERFDVVLVDAPCSGLGIIRKKPDLRYKKADDLFTLPVIQTALLDNAAKYVAPGGVLVYSTCTILPEENEQVTDAFLAEHSGFCREGFTLPEPVGETEGQLTLWPQSHGTDGFYLCRMKRT